MPRDASLRHQLDPQRTGSAGGEHSPDHLGGDLQTGNIFMFEVTGVKIGAFREVSGLEVTLEMDTFNEGGQNAYVHKVPGRMTWSDITFKRGVTNTDALFKWFYETSGEGFAEKNDKIIRRDGAISAYNRAGKRIREWTILSAVPISWKGPEFAHDKADALEETLVISHQGFRVANNRSELPNP
jgi:phage tail-like protein